VLSPTAKLSYARSVRLRFRRLRTSSPSLHRRPRQRGEVSFRLGRATSACLATHRHARRRMRPNRLLPLDSSTTSTRVPWVFDRSRDAFAGALGRTIRRFTMPDSLRWVFGVVCRGGCLRPVSIARRRDHEPSDRTSDPSVASRRADLPAFCARLPTVSKSPRPFLPRVREDHAAFTTRRAFHRR